LLFQFAYAISSSNYLTDANTKECMILNQHYKEYIFADNVQYGKSYDHHRYPYTRSIFGTGLGSMVKSMFSFKTDLSFSDRDPAGLWYIQPVPNRPNAFYLINKHHAGEYLYSFDDFDDREGKSLAVKVGELRAHTKSLPSEAFIWSFKKVDNGDEFYHVWNLANRKPLFADSQTRDMNSRFVRVWHKGPDAGKQFNWKIKCRNNEMPLLTSVNGGEDLAPWKRHPKNWGQLYPKRLGKMASKNIPKYI
jgi:hypothetical protein